MVDDVVELGSSFWWKIVPLLIWLLLAVWGVLNADKGGLMVVVIN